MLLDPSRRYCTALFFLRPGQEAIFEEYESHVLPLLAEHRGRLEYRWRPPANAVVSLAPDVAIPYEVHLVSFASAEDFKAYRRDPKRTRHAELLEQAVTQVLLIDGSAV